MWTKQIARYSSIALEYKFTRTRSEPGRNRKWRQFNIFSVIYICSNRDNGIFEDDMSEVQTKWRPYSTEEGHYLLFRADGITTKTFYRGSAVHFWNVLMPKIKRTENLGESSVKCAEPMTCSKPVVSLLMMLTLVITFLHSFDYINHFNW